MPDNAVIVADPAHLTIHMLVTRMRAKLRVNDSSEMERRKAVLLEGLAGWSGQHGIDFVLSDTAGRRSKGRAYRIACHGDNLGRPSQDALYDAFDAEMLRLMLLP